MKRLSVILATLVLSSAANLSATLIAFTHTAVGSGSVGTTNFLDKAITITALGDTTNRQTLGGFGYFIDHSSALITIDGVGAFHFLTDTRTVVNTSTEFVGFSRAGIWGADLLNGPQDSVFSTWDMLSSIGPVLGEMNLLQWSSPSPDVITVGGDAVIIRSSLSRGMFQAVVDGQNVPEGGSTLAMLGLALVGIVRFVRRAA